MGSERPLVVAVAVAVHRIHDAEIVDDAAERGKEIAHPGARLAVLLESPSRLDEEALEGPRLVEPARGGDRLTMVGDQLRLPVEGVDVRHATGGVEEDHPVGAGGEVRRMRCERIERHRGRRRFGKQAEKRRGEKAAADRIEPGPAGDRGAVGGWLAVGHEGAQSTNRAGLPVSRTRASAPQDSRSGVSGDWAAT